jgi:cardiolipin synthase A/B
MILKALLLIHYSIALFVAMHAIIRARSSQAILAWIIALIFIPYLSLLFYLFFGFTRFSAYAEAIQNSGKRFFSQVEIALDHLKKHRCSSQKLTEQFSDLACVMKNMGEFVFTQNNQVELLIDGEETYSQIFEAIKKAQDYILLQYYIVQNDRLGRFLKNLLIEKAKQGVRIYFLYDAWGAHAFFHHYLRQLRRAGVQVASFQSDNGVGRHRWQLNFRNHRKIVVVDGCRGFTGGINVGEEYLSKRRRPWRDTHLMIEGPAVQSMQLSFCEDWYWAANRTLDLKWQITTSEVRSPQIVSIVPTGPEKTRPTAALLITQLINSAKQRAWIATPYFVPDRTILTALQLAVLRGVDVKILLPNFADHWLVYYCAFSFYNELQDSGIEFYRYDVGFMHQKVILIDEALTSIGSINLDNRSLYINFEMTALVIDKPFSQQVEQMLLQDFDNAKRVELKDYEKRSLWFKLSAGFARLFAPLL